MTLSRRSFIAASAASALTARRAEALSSFAPAPHKPGPFDPWLEIDGAALAHNVDTISRLVGAKPILAVAKNNAYGCGIATVGPLLDRHAAIAGIAVVRPDEAFALRQAG